MSVVSIVKCSDYNIENVTTAMKSSFENLGGIDKFVKPGMKVLLKPNLIMKKRPEEAATTHPAIVQVVSDMVREAGGEVLIADSPGGLYTEKNINGLYKVCGLKDAAENSGVELNFDFTEAEVENPEGKYLKKLMILKPIRDADLVINLPKLKTHGQMVYTGAVKNMFGAIHGVQKAEFHVRMSDYSKFANAIIDIFLSTKTTLNIMDAVIGMDGAGPSAGDPKPIGILLASENAFELDYTATKVVGINPLDVPIIKEACDRDLVSADGNDIKIVGEIIESVRIKDFYVPQLENLRTILFFDKGLPKLFVNSMKPRPVINYEMCTGCLECKKHCPAKIIEVKNKKPVIELKSCIRCYCCQELCPTKAITIKRPLFTRAVMKLSKGGKREK